MSRVDALKELLAKVDVGVATYDDFTELHLVLEGMHGRAFEAYMLGSLDAAKALHDAVLRDWGYSYYSDDGHFIIGHPTDVKIYEETHNSCQARAWLIAILKALIATTTPPR